MFFEELVNMFFSKVRNLTRIVFNEDVIKNKMVVGLEKVWRGSIDNNWLA